MRHDLGFVAAGNKLQAAVFSRGRIERHPGVKGLGFAVAPQSIVLMPRSRAAGRGRFYKDAIKFYDDVVAEKMARHRKHRCSGLKVVPDQRGLRTEVAQFAKAQGFCFRRIAHRVHRIDVGPAFGLGF